MDHNKEGKEGREDERYQQHGNTPPNQGNTTPGEQDRNRPQEPTGNRGSEHEEYIAPKGRRSEDEQQRTGEPGMRQEQQQGTDHGEGRGTGRDTMGGTAQNSGQTGSGAPRANTPGMQPEDERDPSDNDRSGQPRK